MTQSIRKSYIDIIKGIAISFVVFGHISHHSFLRPFIHHSCLSGFFFVSGFLANHDLDFKSFCIKKAKSLLIPYVFFYIITLLYWILIERHVRGEGVSIWSQIVGLFYGTYGKNMMFNGALWFLPSLFSLEIIFYLIQKIKSKIWKFLMITLIILMGIILIENKIFFLPFGIGDAFIFIFYFSLGFLLQTKKNIIENLDKKYLLLFLFLGFIFQIIWINSYFQPFFFTKGCSKDLVFGTLAIIWISSSSLLLKKNKILEFLGKNSLVIFAFQEQTYRALIFIFSKMTNLSIETIRINPIYSFFIFGATILAISPLVWLYNNNVAPLLKKINLN